MSGNFLKYPKLKNAGGLHPKKCKPFQTIGTVTAVIAKKSTYQSKQLGGITTHVQEVIVTFEFEDEDGETMNAQQTFTPGDVYVDSIGGKMLGVAFFTQWGRAKFFGTHVLDMGGKDD